MELINGCTVVPPSETPEPVRFGLGDREVPVTAGTLVFVPRGMPHTVQNSGDRPVRGLILISPGTAEHEFVPVDAG